MEEINAHRILSVELHERPKCSDEDDVTVLK
jgi:hypothetical protein